MSSKGKQVKESRVDAADPSTQYQIQCTKVTLQRSHLRPMKDDEKTTGSSIAFKIEACVGPQIILAELFVRILNGSTEETTIENGMALNFSLMAHFEASQPLDRHILEEFARMYSLTVLWPYAREYASDVFRRTAQPALALPIINPQVVSEMLVEQGLVTVKELNETSAEY